MQDSSQVRASISDSANSLRITPSDTAWKRVSIKLEAHHANKSVRRLRLLSYSAAAAVIILLVAMLAVVQQYAPESNQAYSASVLQLVESSNSVNDIYSVESVRTAYEAFAALGE